MKRSVLTSVLFAFFFLNPFAQSKDFPADRESLCPRSKGKS